ncbi:MAG: HNH endonuclease [Bdellovibrionaceae bacterium]|nr:HNH endonuclease [Pseudobdellovibrionaceae bacterium]
MNILEGFTNQEIDERITRLAKSERKITHLVLSHIEEVRRRKIYLDYGLTSTFQYLTKRHGYCESSAYLRIQAAKVLARHPELQQKIESGSVKLTQLAKVQKCAAQISTPPRVDEGATATNATMLDQNRSCEKTALAQLENKSGFETDKILAIQFQQKSVQHQKITPQSDGSVRLEFSVTAEQFDEIRRAQSHVSHSVVGGQLDQLFVHLARWVNKKVDGGKKATDRSEKCTVSKSKMDLNLEQDLTQGLSAKEKLRKQNRRKYLSVRVRRRLLENAGHCCEHIEESSEVRCDSRFQLQVDHVLPIARGGDSGPENLRILCGVHNRLVAQRMNLFRVASGMDFCSS